MDGRSEGRLATAAMAGGAVGALVTAATCLGPLLAILAGVGGMGFLFRLAPVRIPVTLVTIALVALAFYLAYRRPSRVLGRPLADVLPALAAMRGKPLLIALVRGDWCPLCQFALRVIEQQQAELKERGMAVALVAPAESEVLRALAARLDLHPGVLVDASTALARSLDLATEQADGTVAPDPALVDVDEAGIVSRIQRCRDAVGGATCEIESADGGPSLRSRRLRRLAWAVAALALVTNFLEYYGLQLFV